MLTAVLQNMQCEFEAAIHLLLRHTQQKEKHPPHPSWTSECCRHVRIESKRGRKIKIETNQARTYARPPRLGGGRSGHILLGVGFLGRGERWHLSLCALYHPAIAGGIIVLTRTSCHWLPSAMSTYRRSLVVIRGSGLWLLWVIHNIHIQINRKAFAHGFVFALAFCSSQPSSVRVIAPVQSYKNTESDTRRNHQHGHAA